MKSLLQALLVLAAMSECARPRAQRLPNRNQGWYFRPTFDPRTLLRPGTGALRLLFGAVLLVASAGRSTAATHYVDVNSTNATPPYTDWATAATNIQDAVDAAVAADEIVVTNGGYYAIFVDRPLSVRSVNGPQSASIWGDLDTRCVLLTNGASISGFTLTNASVYDVGGGAVGGTLSNCVVSGNSAWYAGGGAAYCTLNNCTLTGNSAGTYWDTFSSPNESYGGGAYHCTLNNCTLTGNSAQGDDSSYGGGAAFCTLNNCALGGNSVKVNIQDIACHDLLGSVEGGGAYDGTLNNCTLTGNSAIGYHTICGDVLHHFTINITAYGGGAASAALNNCIVYFNTADQLDNYFQGTLNHCCITPQPAYGLGNITNAPLFVDANGFADLRLQSNSPCINAGNNAYVVGATDLDGNPRIVGGTVDIGAYEYQAPVSMISYAWLQQFNLPINTSADSADPDGDGVDNYHEWLAGTDPTNRLSSPAQLTIGPSGVPPSGIILSWSTNAVGFTLQSTTNLGPTALWSTNFPAPVVIAGQNTITNSIIGPQQFYRLVQTP